ncbi:hypothetical protein E2562_038203 [Oryza meyeriana var. granulata]|uniref:Uncharacterized protein n=1 Tax=Oryza meyeriana var. granulata TaxID=110450 RepID=A0A6G1FGU8_9ORYZ|nr:hypothetical protein E2562_038203 [Oryza meyeriana var. granulata]
MWGQMICIRDHVGHDSEFSFLFLLFDLLLVAIGKGEVSPAREGIGEAMDGAMKEQGIVLVRKAVEEDDAGNYARAFPLTSGIPGPRDAISAKLARYIARVEEIRAALLGDAGSGADAAASEAKKDSQAKEKDGGGGGGGGGEDDSERVKLRAGLHSAIVSEKPNVRWNDVSGLDGAKQALQEAVVLPVKFPQFFTGEFGFTGM